MALTSSMRVEPVYSTCTARMFHYIPVLTQGVTDRQVYDFLVNQFNEEIHKSRHRSAAINTDPDWSKINLKDWDENQWETWRNGYALYLYIITEAQEVAGLANTLRRLGFVESYAAEKDHDDSREEGSGALQVWCGQPWTVEEHRLKWIEELKVKLKMTPDLLKKRKEVPALSVKDLADLPVYGGNKIAFYSPHRKRVIDFIFNRTGGFDVTTDGPILQQASGWSSVTPELIVERANLWREGKI